MKANPGLCFTAYFKRRSQEGTARGHLPVADGRPGAGRTGGTEGGDPANSRGIQPRDPSASCAPIPSRARVCARRRRRAGCWAHWAGGTKAMSEQSVLPGWYQPPPKREPELIDEETRREAGTQPTVSGAELVAPAPLSAAKTPAPRQGRIRAQTPQSPHGTKLWALALFNWWEIPLIRPSCVNSLFLNSSSLYTCRPILHSLATTNPAHSSS